MKSSILVLPLLISSYTLGSVITKNDTSFHCDEEHLPFARANAAAIPTNETEYVHWPWETPTVLFTDENDGRGNVAFGYEDNDCININLRNGAKSAHTKGRCYYMFTKADCTGRAIRVAPGTPSHGDLPSLVGGSKLFSASPCDDFCKNVYLYNSDVRQDVEYKRQGGPRRDVAGKCTVLDNSFTIGLLAGQGLRHLYNTIFQRRLLSPITNVQLGYGDRVEYLRADIYPSNLGQGNAVSPATRISFHNQREMRATDQVGHIIAVRLGGTGEHFYNLFPQSRNMNAGQWWNEEDRICNLVSDRGQVTIEFNFFYPNDRSTRPRYFVVRVHPYGQDTYVMRFENP